MCAAPRALKPCMCGSTCRSSSTRSYCSISEEAVRTTSDSGIASRRRRPESMPASTRRDSALRRMRVARWSRRKRLARVLGSSSARSRESMNDSWRLRRTWSRRATLTNISAMEPRRAACSWATWTVVEFTELNAAASWPTSSRDVTGMGASVISGPSPGTATCSTSRGSCSRTSTAATVRRRSGTTMPRATRRAKKRETTTAAMTMPMVTSAWVWASVAAGVGDDRAASSSTSVLSAERLASCCWISAGVGGRVDLRETGRVALLERRPHTGEVGRRVLGRHHQGVDTERSPWRRGHGHGPARWTRSACRRHGPTRGPAHGCSAAGHRRSSRRPGCRRWCRSRGRR